MKSKTRFMLLLTIVAFVVVAIGSMMTTAGAEEVSNVQKDLDIQPVSPEDVKTTNVGSREPIDYIVILAGEPLVSYKGGVDGLAATNPGVRNERKLDVNSAASIDYLNYLSEQRAVALSEIEQTLGRTVETDYVYEVTLNGFSANFTAAEAAKILQLDSVINVEEVIEYELHTDAGPAWIGAPSIWDGSATGVATRGEGVIVGVIDTGIDPWNPSFLDVGDDGYDHTNPWGSGTYVGVCDSGDPSYDPTFPCNDKLIGAWGYASVNSGDPRDSNGHGSHTASTAAGNVVYGATITTSEVFTADISGVAPHANIIMYAACCTGDALAAAIDQLVIDGVDVVNYSIGSPDPTPNPWGSANAVQWLNVRDAGIFVATSNGNAGNADYTTGSPSDLPWLTSVGANSHNRAFLTTITVTSDVSPTMQITGQSMYGGLFGPAPIVSSSWYTLGGTIDPEDARLCADGVFPPGTFSGEIVICERGGYGRVAKGQTVLDGGAGGYILAQPDEATGGPGSMSTDTHVLPSSHIDYYTYQDLLAYLNTSPISGTIGAATFTVNDDLGDIMASFSSRGPNSAIGLEDYIVPNVTAPGRAIWAAYHQGSGGDGDYTYNVIQGTSMSSPHVAGAGALLVALYPDWTPAEIESALMGTARSNVLNDDGVEPTTAHWFDQGSGHIDLEKAANTGLVMDVTTAEFEAADPTLGGSAKDLNVASLGNSQCVLSCSWQRTVTSVYSETVTWTVSVSGGFPIAVSPSVFTIDPDETQVLTVTADVSGEASGAWIYGDVILNAEDDVAAEFHLPVAVIPATGSLPPIVEIETRRDAGSQEVTGLEAHEITDLTITSSGLEKAIIHTGTLTQIVDQDADFPDIFFDNLAAGRAFTATTVAEAGDLAVIFDVVDTTSPDLDLLMGFDSNGNGQPDPGEDTCQSASGGSFEYCEELYPAAGTWWVIVINWQASGSPPDSLSVAGVSVPDSDNGNMSVTGPSSVPAGEPFDIRIFWDLDDAMEGDKYYGFLTLGSDPSNPDNVGTIPVTLSRVADDVTKEASATDVLPGETVAYTITVGTNVLNEDITYWLTDTIPAGLTYVSGTVTTTAGMVSVTGDTLTWSGVQQSAFGATGSYIASTNASDPSCDTGFGGYVDLESLAGLFPASGVSGDSNAWTAFSGQNPVQFYAIDNEGISFTDDGFAFLDSTPGGTPWVNTALPDGADPNDLMAVLWNDMEIVYDGTPGSVRGVTLATAGPDTSIIEYDDMEPWPAGGSSDRYDFEIIVNHTINDAPGAYEIIFAYDNFTGMPSDVTVGLENVDGTAATEFLFGDPSGVIMDGLIICFDYQGPQFEPVTITYQVTVDEDAVNEMTNVVVSQTDNPGSQEEETSATVTGPFDPGMTYIYLPVIAKP